MCMCQICLPFYFCCITISHLVYCSPLLICLQDSFCNHILAKVTILNEPVKSSLRLESGCPIILHHWRQFGPSYLPNISFSKFQPHSLSFGYYISQFSSVQSLSLVWLFTIPWTAVSQAFLSITNTWVLFKFMCMELVMPFNHVIWLWLRGVWECAAGPMLCVPNYMHLECVSSLSWTLCCRIHWWDWVWLSQDMTHAEYAMGICYWTSVYRQFNEKLKVVLTIYSFLI